MGGKYMYVRRHHPLRKINCSQISPKYLSSQNDNCISTTNFQSNAKVYMTCTFQTIQTLFNAYHKLWHACECMMLCIEAFGCEKVSRHNC